MSKHSRDDDILHAAARLFKSRGIGGTTIRAIAEEAGVLPGSITYRYPTKDALIVAMMERAIEHASSEVLDAVAESRDPVERLRLAARAHLRVLLSGEPAVHVLLFDWARLSDTTREAIIRLRSRYESIWDGMVYEAAGSGRFVPGIDLSLLRLFVFGALNSSALWYRPGGLRSPEEIADAFSVFIGLGVLDQGRRPLQSMDEYPRRHALSKTADTGAHAADAIEEESD